MEPSTGCWLWSRGLSKENGYGKFYYEGKVHLAHRFSYALYNGVPDGVVCHWCNVPSCVNPNHLYLGTQSDNILQASKEGRIKKKLSDAQIESIRNDFRTLYEIADDYRVSFGYVGQLKRREKRCD